MQHLDSDLQGNRSLDRVKTVKGAMRKAQRESCPRPGLCTHSHNSITAIPVSCCVIAQAQVHSVGQIFRKGSRKDLGRTHSSCRREKPGEQSGGQGMYVIEG